MDPGFLLIDIFIPRIILLSMLKEGLILKKIIKFYLGINNNIILRMNISMSKNTESIDITNVCNIVIQ